MKLVSVAIERFRSILKARKIALDDYTVFVGPNNEGKSNILHALTVAMLAIGSYERGPNGRPNLGRRLRLRKAYDWSRDFPLHLQSIRGVPQTSVITVEVELDDQEVADFQVAIKSRVNGVLAIAVSFNAEGFPTLRVKKRGPGGKALTKKSNAIADFIASRMRFEHIPAVRTAEAAQKVVEALLAAELSQLEDQPEYQAAVQKIEDLQVPILKEVSSRVRDTLGPFLPSLTDVEVAISSAGRFEALRTACEIYLDDGARTPLKSKGDGVQSLAALALMRDASRGGAGDRHLVIAIEEPESHLHPGAVHELRKLLAGLSVDHQVVITSHNPLFVDRGRCDRNVIVRDKRAVPAKSLAELREALGVRATDNLQHASLVLVVEGESDRKVIMAALQSHSARIATGLADGDLSIDSMHGTGNLLYKLSVLRNSLYPYAVLLDADAAGRAAATRALEDGLIGPTDVFHTTLPNRKEAELEDWIRPELYANDLGTRFAVKLDPRRFKGRQKWSTRMGSAFAAQGKLWDDGVCQAVKTLIANLAIADPSDSFVPEAEEVLGVLVDHIVERLDVS